MNNIVPILFLYFLGALFPVGVYVAISKNNVAWLIAVFTSVGVIIGIQIGLWMAKKDQKRRSNN